VTPLIVAVDVQYASDAATAAAVGFAAWPDAVPALEHVLQPAARPAAYEPGAFYKRELPFLLEVLAQVEARIPLAAVIVDGHAWLREGEPGLGARLHEALGGRAPVVGVAKSAYDGGIALPVLRGGSKQPLFVSAAAMDAQGAAELVRRMHGPHRLPTLLGRAGSPRRIRRRGSGRGTPREISARAPPARGRARDGARPASPRGPRGR
jgi:deoxyribonuclease V